MTPPRLLVADDHEDIRALLRSVLEPEFRVVADCQDGRALVSAADRLSPDVIVTDISMPGLDGIAAATAIVRANPEARIVFVTVHNNRGLVDRGLATGALGYVLKREVGDELVPAVRAALNGERYIGRL
jgi:DNA-binding NarL/FixJ family response regulator